MADRALKLAHARFTRVLDDHLLDDAFAKLQVTRLQAVRRALASDEIALGDLQLLLLGVARQRDDLHAVAQGARDIREAVRRDDPKNLGEIEGKLDVMIAERRVLRGIEHFEERRRRIALVVHGDLVHFVEQEYGILRARLAQPFHDASRHCTDVGAAMSANLRLVTDAAQRRTHELPARRPRHGACQRRLANARRAYEAQDRRMLLLRELVDGKVFENALLDLLESVVILIQDSFRRLDVDVVLRGSRPRKFKQCLDIGTYDAHLGRHARLPLHAVDFLLDRLLHVLGIVALGKFLAVRFDIRRLVVLVAQFLLNRLDLLAQVIVLLDLFHLLAHAHADLALHLKYLKLTCQNLIEKLHAVLDIDLLKERLPVLNLETQVARDEVAQASRIVENRHGNKRLGGNLLAEFHPLLEFMHDGACQSLHLHGFLHDLGVFDDRHLGKGFQLFIRFDCRTLLPLDEHAQSAARKLQQLAHLGDRADIVEIFLSRLISLGILLRHEQDLTVAHHRFLQGCHGALPANVEMDDHEGKHNHSTQRQERQLTYFRHKQSS